MFGKKCSRCGKKVSKEDNFCPKCGNNFMNVDSRENKVKERKDYGLLGKEDEFGDFFRDSENSLFGSGGMFDFNNIIREFDKQFRLFDKQLPAMKKPKTASNPREKTYSSGISISISASNDGEPKISVRKFGDGKSGNEVFEEKRNSIKEKPIKKNLISDEKAKRISKLPREEAKSNVRRMSKKIVYEIDLPGVKSLEDVIIQRLENSIEIKAFSDKKAYFKLLPINFPISNYKLKEEKLILELIDEDN